MILKYFFNIRFNKKYKKVSYSEIIKYNTCDSKYNTNVIFQQTDIISASLKNYDKNILILNFASPFFPGGGYKLGFTTQEESLCYATSLYGEISKIKLRKFYFKNFLYLLNPVYTNEAILSRKVTIYRDNNFNLLKEPKNIDILTIAAPNNNFAKMMPWISEKQIQNAMKKKIELINFIINKYKYQTVILGAFGCGAFGNDIKNTAKIFKENVSFPGNCIYAIPNIKTFNIFKDIITEEKYEK